MAARTKVIRCLAAALTSPPPLPAAATQATTCAALRTATNIDTPSGKVSQAAPQGTSPPRPPPECTHKPAMHFQRPPHQLDSRRYPSFFTAFATAATLAHTPVMPHTTNSLIDQRQLLHPPQHRAQPLHRPQGNRSMSTSSAHTSGPPLEQVLDTLKPRPKGEVAYHLMAAEGPMEVLQVLSDQGSGVAQGNGVECALWKLARTCWGMEKEEVQASIVSSPDFQGLINFLVYTPHLFSPSAFTKILLYLSMLHYDDTHAVDNIVCGVLGGIEELAAKDLINLVQGLLNLQDVTAPNLVVLDQIKSRLQDLPPDQISDSQRECIEGGLQLLGHGEMSPSKITPPQRQRQSGRSHHMDYS